jgi:hypothetical protein
VREHRLWLLAVADRLESSGAAELAQLDRESLREVLRPDLELAA